MAGLLLWRVKQVVKAVLLRKAGRGIERTAVALLKSRNRTLRGFNLILQARPLPRVALDPVAPVAVLVMVVEFVVDDLADQLPGRD
jgi:hypothetical protein